MKNIFLQNKMTICTLTVYMISHAKKYSKYTFSFHENTTIFEVEKICIYLFILLTLHLLNHITDVLSHNVKNIVINTYKTLLQIVTTGISHSNIHNKTLIFDATFEKM